MQESLDSWFRWVLVICIFFLSSPNPATSSEGKNISSLVNLAVYIFLILPFPSIFKWNLIALSPLAQGLYARRYLKIYIHIHMYLFKERKKYELFIFNIFIDTIWAYRHLHLESQGMLKEKWEFHTFYSLVCFEYNVIHCFLLMPS